MKRLLLLTIILLILALIVSPISAGGQENRRLPYRFLIPEGYVGWIRIDFNVTGTPPLREEDGYYLVKIPLTGRLQTSSRETITRGDQYFYTSSDAKYQLELNQQTSTRMIQDMFWGPGPNQANPPKPYFYFFIGPRAEYEKCKFDEPCNERDEDGYLKAGPRLWLSKEDMVRLQIKHQ